MPGVFLGKSCLVGPAAIVFENVPDSTKLVTKTQTQILKTKDGNRKG
jgi:hypothetical protein